jgi:hypothetical protein
MLLLTALLARADVPPEEGYVETCTVAIQCGPDVPGELCWADFSSRAGCEPLEKRGWQQMCRGWGGTSWDEVFCERAPDEAARQARIAQAMTPRRCGCAAGGASGGWLLTALLAASRRRATPAARR